MSAWREPATGAVAGRASVNGSPRGRAEVRSAYSDMLAPMSPPVSAPPPAQQPTTSLHYGHYGPDGQGWPSSVNQPETSQSSPATGTVTGGSAGGGIQAPQDGGQVNGAHPGGLTGAQPVVPSGGTVYGAAASPAAQARDEAVQPTSGGYGPPPSALDRLTGQSAPVDPRVRVHGDSGQPPYGAYPDPAWGYDTRPRNGAYQEQPPGANGAARTDAPAEGQQQYPPQEQFQPQEQYAAQDQFPPQGYQAQQYQSQEYPQQQYQSQEYPQQEYPAQPPQQPEYQPPEYQQQGYQRQDVPQHPQEDYRAQQDAYQDRTAYRPQDGYSAYPPPANGYQPYEQQQTGPEFDWAAPQHDPAQAQVVPAPAAPQLPTQRMPEDDPLVGPLPAELLGSATPLSAAEPKMPTFASEPPYAQNLPAESGYAEPAYAEPQYAEPQYAEPAYAAPTYPAPVAAAEADYNGPELPQRVPSHPDVPQVPEVEVEPLVAEAGPAGGAELARIATFLREDREDEDDEPSLDDRPDGFDIPAVLRAVQGVAGVREATLRKNADGLHTLRLELLDEADPGLVSRAVARLLNERMGLAAEPNPPHPSDLTPPAQRQPARGNAPHSALPGYGREARRRRPVSGVRRPAEAPRPDLDEFRQPPSPPRLIPQPEHEALAPSFAPDTAPDVEPDVAPGTGTKPPGGRLTGTVTGQLPGHAPAPASSPVLGPQPPIPVNRESPPALVPHSSTIVSPRVIIDQVEVSTQGVDAVVEVRLIADGHPAVGVASGPAVDGYILRLSAAAAASAVDQLLVDVDATARARCYIEHAAVVQLGGCEVAVVVLLLLYDGWVEQLTGSSVNSGDPRQAVVRATLAAVNRRLEALLP
ncbi:hypothetical protein AB0K00_55025 [Dactylosporangium sp. NPDC049525]|uniref:hypothetical protein n=1 Tax=Dactylosporangium sp. NPDC049525 TaxID=3154730 RepID=UPI003415AAA5